MTSRGSVFPLPLSESFKLDVAEVIHMLTSIKSTMIIAGRYLGIKIFNPNKPLAYVGLYPSIYQSEKLSSKENENVRMPKHGSKVLIYALVNATHNVEKFNTTFKAYHDAKMAKGRDSLKCH